MLERKDRWTYGLDSEVTKKPWEGRKEQGDGSKWPRGLRDILSLFSQRADTGTSREQGRGICAEDDPYLVLGKVLGTIM